MHTPEEYLLDALEVVMAWGLPDDAAVAAAANAQARLMSGCFDSDDSRGDALSTDIVTDH